MGDTVDDLADKRFGEHGPGVGLGDAALLGVEQRLLVQGPDGVAMGAGDVVGEDLQLRLGVHLGPVGEDQRVVAHPGVRAVGAGLDDDAALEHATRLVGDHALGQLVGGAVDALVGDHGGDVGLALFVEEIDAVQSDRGAAPRMGQPRLDPLTLRPAGQNRLCVGGLWRQEDLCRGHADAAGDVVEQDDPFQPGACLKEDF